MSQVKWWVAVTAMAMLTAALPALAEQPAPVANPSITAGMPSNEMLIRSDKFIGARVQDNSGNKLGTIKDIVLSSDHKIVLYAVLEHGGTLGMGEKLFAVPWQSLKPQVREHGKIDFVTLDISKDMLDKNSGFDKNNWPDRPNTMLFKVVVIGRSSKVLILGRETVMQGGISKYQKVSELDDLKVQNDRNNKLGNISCLLISEGKGMVEFALIGHGGILGAGEKYSAVPWEAIQVQENNKLALLRVDKKTLENNSFAMKDYPNFSDRQYTMNLYKVYGVQPGGVTARETNLNWDVWKEGSDYNKKFDASKVTTVEGTVQSVRTFTIAENSAPGMLIELKTDKETLMVHTGPTAFVDSKSFKLSQGDKISVTGSRIEMEGKPVLMAGEIKKGTEMLMLRDSNGKVLWNVKELQGHEMKENVK